MNIDLEGLSENITNEGESLEEIIDEFKNKRNEDVKHIIDRLNPIKSNILNYADTVYAVFENPQYSEDEVNDLMRENELLKELLAEHVSDEDKMYLRIKYDIELGV